MIELKNFITSICDSISEAEIQSLQHGESRLAELLGSRTVPEDISMPVYHASNVEVVLEVGLKAEDTENGMKVYVEESSQEKASTFKFTIEPYDLIEKGNLKKIDYGDIFGPETPSIDIIRGVDSTYYEVLRKKGIEKLSDLAESSPEDISEMVSGESVEISPETARDWIEQAKGLLEVISKSEEDLSVELVDGIGPTFRDRLSENGIETLSDLVELPPVEVSRLASTEESRVSSRRAEQWIEKANSLLGMARGFGSSDKTPDEKPDNRGNNSEVER